MFDHNLMPQPMFRLALLHVVCDAWLNDPSACAYDVEGFEAEGCRGDTAIIGIVQIRHAQLLLSMSVSSGIVCCMPPWLESNLGRFV